MSNDTDLQHEVEKELSWEPGVNPKHIAVTARHGIIDLTGDVDTYWEKCAASRAAARVAQVRQVVSHLRVDLPFAATRSDDDLALAAMAALEANCVVPATVEVLVNEGVLTLSGAFEWYYQSDEAERALTPLVGLRGIRNEITVRPSTPPAESKAGIEEAFKRSALIDSSHIKPHVAHGVVTLRGNVRTAAERDEALHAARCLPGVTKLDDHITIGTA